MAVTPNMNIVLPTPTITPGPDWAVEVNESFDVVDAHDHTPGNGALIPTAGIDIDADFSLNSFSLIEADHVEMDQQSAILGPSVADAIYDVNGDLYFNNGAGTPVQITTGNSVNVSATALVPSGVLFPYAGVAAPLGFLLCDGAAISRSTYSDLFIAIGTTFGPGDGSTTFNIPNMNGRAPIGAGTYTDPVLGSVTRTLGAAAGEASHELTASENAAHNHDAGAHTHQVFANTAIGGVTVITNTTAPARARSSGDAQDYLMVQDGTAPTVGRTSAATGVTGDSGTNAAHNTMQPYLVTNFIIKY